jgi:hypothetical protein
LISYLVFLPSSFRLFLYIPPSLSPLRHSLLLLAARPPRPSRRRSSARLDGRHARVAPRSARARSPAYHAFFILRQNAFSEPVCVAPCGLPNDDPASSVARGFLAGVRLPPCVRCVLVCIPPAHASAQPFALGTYFRPPSAARAGDMLLIYFLRVCVSPRLHLRARGCPPRHPPELLRGGARRARSVCA